MKRLGLLLGFTLLVVLFVSLGLPSPAIASQIWFSGDEIGITHWTYGGYGEEIRIDGIITHGPEDLLYNAADIYIVPNGNVSGHMETELVDVSGLPNTFVMYGSGTFMSEVIGYVGTNGLTNGKYDIVIDEDQDQKFKPGVDTIYHADTDAAITIRVSETGISLSGLHHMQQAKQLAADEWTFHTSVLAMMEAIDTYKKLSGLFETLAEMGMRDGIAKALWDIALDNAKPSFSYPGPLDAFKKMEGDLAAHWLGIAADPPDPVYDVPVTLEPQGAPAPLADDPMDTDYFELAAVTERQVLCADALLHAMEKYQGACADENGYWALTHAREIKLYATLLSEESERARLATAQLRASLAADTTDLDGAATELAEFQARVRENGLTPADYAVFQGAGYTDAEIESARQEFLAMQIGVDKAAALSALDARLTWCTAEANTYKGLALDIDEAISVLVNYGTDKTQPVPSAGGPYVGSVGDEITFNASASTDPRSLSLTYQWDIDGDGQFDDATGSQVTTTTAGERHGFVGVKVTNLTGERAVSYARIDVTDPVPVPEFMSLEPSHGYVHLAPGESCIFAAVPVGEGSIRWLKGSLPVGVGSNLTFTPTLADIGNGNVTAEVRAPGESSRARQHTWAIDVVQPVTPPIVPPVLDVQSVSDITPSGAKLAARIVTGTSSSFEAHFEYRRTGDTVWVSTPSRTAAPSSTLELAETLAGLEEGTQYEFRTVMSCEGTTKLGDTSTFSTIALASLVPTITGVLAGPTWPTDVVNLSNTTSFTAVGIAPQWTEGWAVEVIVSDGVDEVIGMGMVEQDRTFSVPGVNAASLLPGMLAARARLIRPGGAGGPMSEAKAILYDPIPPQCESTLPGDGVYTNNPPSAIELKLFDAVGAVGRARTASTARVSGGGTWTASWSGTDERPVLRLTPATRPGDGTYSVALTLWDSAGNSTQFSFWFVIDTRPPTLSITPSGAWPHGIIVYAGANEPTVTIYYTKDGSEPTTQSPVYTSPLPVNETTTLRFLAVDFAGNKSVICTNTYIIDKVAPQLMGMIPADGSYVKDDTDVTIYMADEGGSGIDTRTAVGGLQITGPSPLSWAQSWNEAGNALTLHPSGPMAEGLYTVYFYLRDRAGNIAYFNTPSTAKTFRLDRTAPVVTPNLPGGYYDELPLVIFMDTNEPCTIYYTTDGSEPTADSSVWPGALVLHQAATLRFFAIDPVGLESPKMTETYTLGYSAVPGATRTYTGSDDFRQGLFFNTNAQTPGEVRLNQSIRTFSNMWVANAGEDTLSKIDTKNNRETARYRTWFGPKPNHGAWDGTAPSRTAVDSEGNAYVANRQFDYRKPASVMKVLANGGIDRNGNGTIDTSVDLNGNGRIDATEILPMTDANSNGRVDPSEIPDERVAWLVEVGPNNGCGRALAIDPDGNLWLGLYNAQCYYKLSSVDGRVLAGPVSVSPQHPYGALVDGDGMLWGESWQDNSLLKLDTRTNAKLAIYSHQSFGTGYSLALANHKVYIASYSGYSYIQFDPATETFTIAPPPRQGTLGIATDSGGNIVIGSGAVYKYRPDGTIAWTTYSQAGTGEIRGISIDSEDNVWLIHRNTNSISKHRGSDGAPLGVFPVGEQPYTYSDATGIGRFLNTSPNGTWSIVQDSRTDQTAWGKISWNAEPEGSTQGGSAIVVEARAADLDRDLVFHEYVPVSNSVSSEMLHGRFIQVRVRLLADADGNRPVLSDLTVEPYAGSNPPELAPIGDQAVDEAQNLSFFVSATDPDGDALTYTATNLPPGAQFDTATGLFSWTPTFEQAGVYAGITFQVTDGILSDSETIAITVTNVNRAPAAQDLVVVTDEDTGKDIVLSASDADGDVLTYSIVDAPAHGTLSGTAPTLTYTPHANYHGPDSFTYQVSDGTADSDLAHVSLTVRPVNDAPVARADAATTPEDVPATIDVLANDSDVDGDELSVSGVAPGAHGQVTINQDGTLTYTPDPDYNGSDWFGYTISDGNGGTATAEVAMEITPVNDAPVLSAIADQTIDEAASRSVAVSAFDVDGDTLTLSAEGLPAFATFTDNGDGTATLALAPGYDDAGTYGPLTVTASDGTASDTETFGVVVRNVNRAPAAAVLAVTAQEDALTPILLEGSDPDGDVLTYMVVAGSGPVHGTLTGVAPTLLFAPAPDWFGSDSFDYTVTDPSGATAAGSVRITITPVNDGAMAADDAVTTPEDTPVSVAVLANDSDPDGDTLSVTAVGRPAHGTTTANSDGTITYAPAANYHGPDTFTYTASDGAGGDCQATVYVTITPVNDPPTADAGPDQTVDENTLVRLAGSGSDVDGDVLACAWTQTAGPTVTLSNASAEDPTFTAPDVSADTVLTLTLTVSDGTAHASDSVNITVRNVGGGFEGARSKGYWKTHPEHVAQMLASGPLDCGDTTIMTVSQAVAVLGDANAKDARYALRAQLAAACLNLRNNADPTALGYDIRPIVAQARSFLVAHPKPVLSTSSDRTTCLSLKDKLDAYNNSGE